MFALFEDDLTIIHETAGFAAFGSSTSGYGYSPPSATLALCPVLQQEARVFTPISIGEGLGVGLLKNVYRGGGKMLKKHEMINAYNAIVTHYKYLCKLMINLLYVIR